MVATLQFNTKAHQEAYFGVPSMGAVLHTLNFRLHHDQLAWIINHAQDRVIICEGFLLPRCWPFVPNSPPCATSWSSVRSRRESRCPPT